MKDTIREYFKIMVDDGFDIEAAKDNLIEIIEYIGKEEAKKIYQQAFDKICNE